MVRQCDREGGYAKRQDDVTRVVRLVATTEAGTGSLVSIMIEGPADNIDVRF